MDANTRREKILRSLENGKTVNAAQLAERFGVTRQIIVSDIARLRSAGNEILAGKNGYSLPRQTEHTMVISCRHSTNQLQQELYTVVDNGGTVVDEAIEHPVYGTVRVAIGISSRHAADELMKKLRDSRAGQLSELTGGLHSHTVSAPDREALERIRERLSRLGLLAREAASSSSAPAWMF